MSGVVAMLAIAACDGEAGKLTIRSTGTPLAAERTGLSSRVAEARAQFALGNIALALETFRRAVREEPGNIAAITGLAACYDRMGRFDVSRKHYEAALALEPANEQALAALAASFDLQGKVAEAAGVRDEIRQRRAGAGTISLDAAAGPVVPATWSVADAASAPSPRDHAPPTGASPDAATQGAVTVVVPPAPARSVTVLLPAPRPFAAPASVPTRVAADPPIVPAPAASRTGPRLERTSLAEVTLVTLNATPVWRAQAVRRTQAATVRVALLDPARAAVPIRLLNAARVDRLAAHTRALMARRGWKNVVIGNAGAVRARSIVLYPASIRQAGQRLAAQLGFRSAVRAGRGEVTVILGSDAAGLAKRRAAT